MFRSKVILPLYILLFPVIGGFADASSFLISGIFTGHLTGNLVLGAVYTIQKNYHLLFHSIIAIIGFTTGSILGVWFRLQKQLNFIYKTSIALFVQFFILTFIFIIHLLFQNNISHMIFFGGLSVALGLQNGTINSLYKIGIHSSYVTGMTTTLINNYFTLTKNDPEYSHKITSYRMQFFVILAFIFGAVMGVICIYFFQFKGFSLLGVLLLLSIILSIYLKNRNLV